VSPSARAAGAAIVVVGFAVTAFVAQRVWLSYHPVMRASTYTEAQAAAAAIDRAAVPVSRPLVFVLDDHGPYAWSRAWIAAHTIRAALPAERVGHTYFFVGRPADLLAHRPSSLPSKALPAHAIDPATYRSLSETYFAGVRAQLARQPVVFVLASANPGFADWLRTHPSASLSPGVAVVDGGGIGGLGSGAHAVTASPPVSPAGVVAVAIVALAVISLAGAGWSVTLVGRWMDLAGRAALAPAIGTAALVIGAIVFGRLDVKLTPTGSVLIVAAVALIGWAGPMYRRLAPSRRGVER
jgi:hypothetical protein